MKMFGKLEVRRENSTQLHAGMRLKGELEKHKSIL
jgi:hypothetical protein